MLCCPNIIHFPCQSYCGGYEFTNLIQEGYISVSLNWKDSCKTKQMGFVGVGEKFEVRWQDFQPVTGVDYIMQIIIRNEDGDLMSLTCFRVVFSMCETII